MLDLEKIKKEYWSCMYLTDESNLYKTIKEKVIDEGNILTGISIVDKKIMISFTNEIYRIRDYMFNKVENIKINILSKDEFEVIQDDKSNTYKYETDNIYEFISVIRYVLNNLNIYPDEEQTDKLIKDVRNAYKE